ncbi:hypothetical protein GCM10007216_39750 [Thalassobacillus devorans]|uniref:Uncharacterized protein n=1 Tax=Thalassobacillus devorans TaxID=279813 RepID=A0ABQ1PVI9_9BACI|nr:hypothetical protein [Thalassobacillus devorans]NIK30902.1 hypothetical protein [Thalassobacillus devorans]GGD05144.1 hypothetical protein GCM10007216_39750 [Thalassobacillus devorans]
MAKKRNQVQQNVTRTAKTIKDGADAAFDAVQGATEAVESAAMNTVDKTADAINKAADDDKEDESDRPVNTFF